YATTLNNFSAPSLVAEAIGASGPTFAISTACSSSAKVFAAAARLMRAGWIDAAVVGGVDSLCLTTLCGFSALELLSREPCRPFDRARQGISIGEGAGFALLERSGDAPVHFLGAGESSDAHHMSTPHPEGLGARLAMSGALDSAGLTPGAVDYINLHGTATRANDLAEGRAVADLFGDTASSSTKGWFGHLLGAAGIVESVVTMLALEHRFLPGTLHTTDLDPDCANMVLIDNDARAIDVALTNSFGFGGSNCSVIFGRGAMR
ncbi:MAG: beta-ketoacyl synthase N-terminal-like domain-containing protein, partial [Burkholderiaceae bacterium]